LSEPKRAAPRLFVDDPLSEGSTIALAPEQTHYLVQVLRLKPGDKVLLFNGRDGEWLGAILSATRKSASITLESQTRPQPAGQDFWFVFAPLKSARLDYLVQKAVEMGASAVLPVFTERTQAQRFNSERARANMIEAAEQCEILTLPSLAAEQKLQKLLGTWPKQRRMIFCDEEAPLSNPVDALNAVPQDEPLAIIIGPEGGFSPTERQFLLALTKVTQLSLGPRILRADTAAVAAMAVVQSVLGDWRS
jgi:16S rRNA (uracil1498-N3)-methyltransferase